MFARRDLDNARNGKRELRDDYTEKEELFSPVTSQGMGNTTHETLTSPRLAKTTGGSVGATDDYVL
jgi:hypothetical protein